MIAIGVVGVARYLSTSNFTQAEGLTGMHVTSSSRRFVQLCAISTNDKHSATSAMPCLCQPIRSTHTSREILQALSNTKCHYYTELKTYLDEMTGSNIHLGGQTLIKKQQKLLFLDSMKLTSWTDSCKGFQSAKMAFLSSSFEFGYDTRPLINRHLGEPVWKNS